MYASLLEGGQQLLDIVSVREIYASIYQRGFQCFLRGLLSVKAENLQADETWPQHSDGQIVICEPHPFFGAIRGVA